MTVKIMIKQKLTTSDAVFAGLILTMFMGKVIWIAFKVDHPLVQQSTNSWTMYFLAAILGFVALKLAQKTGFPDIWDIRISNRQRFVIPLLTGLGFGILNIIIAYVMQLDVPMVAFPFSIPVYMSVGILMEILLHLIPIVVLLWFLSNVILRKRWQYQVFWVVAILFSLIEPVLQTIGMFQMGIISDISFAVILFTFVFAANMVPIYFFRMYGFLAPVVWRLSFYFIWHIVWGGIYY
jgi:hypothetical protein